MSEQERLLCEGAKTKDRAECCQQEVSAAALAGMAEEVGGKGVSWGHFGREAHRWVTPTCRHLEVTAASCDFPSQMAETALRHQHRCCHRPGGTEASQQTTIEGSPGEVND